MSAKRQWVVYKGESDLGLLIQDNRRAEGEESEKDLGYWRHGEVRCDKVGGEWESIGENVKASRFRSRKKVLIPHRDSDRYTG